MSQFAPMALKNAADATVTFTPVSLEIGGPALAAHRPSGSVNLQKLLAITPRSNQTLMTNTVRVKFTLPIVRQVDGVDTVVENIIADLSIRFPYGANDTERSDILALIESLVNGTDAPDVLATLKGTEAIW